MLYSFGMLVPNRHANTPEYRYGFQGQEMDDELKGEGNSLNYTFRMHDPRVGRFFAVDPMTHQYPWYTPYQFSGNRTIQFIEREGLEEAPQILSGNLDNDLLSLWFLQTKDGIRNVITFPLIRVLQSDETEGETIRKALGELKYDKELYGSISNVSLAQNFDIRGYGGYLDVFPEKDAGDQLLTFVGDALDVASAIPTKNDIFLAVRTGIGASTVSNILKGLKIARRTKEILDDVKWIDAARKTGVSKLEAQGIAIFEETFNVTTRALDNVKDYFKAGNFIGTSGKYFNKSIDLVSAVPGQKFDEFLLSVKKHYKKQGVDYINIDMRALNAAEKTKVQNYVKTLSKKDVQRTIITQ